jgi:hypothetical protein
MLPIYIPSRSRWGQCLTLDQLGPVALRGRAVHLVVPHEQRKAYEKLARANRDRWGPVLVMSEPGVVGIAATRKLIGTMADAMGYDKFIMFDDDLRFAVRLNPKEKAHDKRRLGVADSDDCRNMLNAVDRELDTYAHVGIRIRMAYHDKRLGYPTEQCVRALRALAYRTKLFNTCKHGRVAIMEDFDVTLQLLARGWPNSVLTHWTQDQTQTQLPGGCSDYRTHKLHQANVMKMHRLWPTVTQLREKNNKTGGEFGKRVELTVQWKKTLGLHIQELAP